MNTSFQIIKYSKLRAAIIMYIPLLILPILVPIARQTFGGIWEYLVGFFVIFIGILNMFITPKYLAKSILKLDIASNTLTINCITPFFGNRKNSNQQTISFNDIKSYKYEHSTYFNTFKITLKNNKKFVIHRWYYDCLDEFDKFLLFFIKNVKVYNKDKNTQNVILKDNLIMENRTFLIFIGLTIISIFITTIILIITKGINNPKGIIYILCFSPPLFWLIKQIYNGLFRKY